jgi:polysaccharide pyruvyl transferase WcaK-like protein
MADASDLRLSSLGLPRARKHRRAREPRVLVVGGAGTGDLGEDAVLAVALRSLDPAAEPRVLSRNPVLVEALHGVRAIPASARNLAASLSWCDGLVVVGGSLAGPGLPLLVSACLATGREAAYLAIGGCSGMSRSVRGLVRFTVRRGARITVRDELSADLLALPQDPPVVGDLATRLPSAPVERAWGALAGAGVPGERPLLLLAPKAMADEGQTLEQVRIMAAAARAWLAYGGSVAGLALSTHADFGIDLTRRDEALIAEVSATLGADLPVIGPLLAPEVAKAVVGQARAVLGARLHALVLAAGQGVCSLGFGWEEQTIAFQHRQHRPVLPERPVPRDAVDWVDELRLTAPRTAVGGGTGREWRVLP